MSNLVFEAVEYLWFYFAILVLAVDAVMVLWFQGSLFATLRAHAELWSELPNKIILPFKIILPLLGELLSCPLCLSLHVAYWLFVLARGVFLPSGGEAIFILAAAGLAYRYYQWHK